MPTGLAGLALAGLTIPGALTQHAGVIINTHGLLNGAIVNSPAIISPTGANPGLISERSSSSNYSNDADEISKILQQSCTQKQQNGSAEGERERDRERGERKKHGSNSRNATTASDTGDDEKVATTTTTSSTSSSSSSGRKRRPISKQSSSELLEIMPDDDHRDRDKDNSNATETASTASGSSRRQSPRMASSGTGKSSSQDRLSGSKGGDEDKESSNNIKSWSSRRGKTTTTSNHSSREKNHNKTKANFSEDEDEDSVSATGDNDAGVPVTDVWLVGSDENGPLAVDGIRESNFAARTVIFHDVRRPGRCYSQLLGHLELIRGDFETQFAFVQMCIAEAMRFHRKKMATTIQEWWDQRIDRITRGGGGGSNNNGSGVMCEAATEPAVLKVVKVETTSTGGGGGGKGSGRQKSNVKLRSGTGATVPASKC